MTKREMFVLEYLVDLNGTQAAIRAGYSPKSAYSQGSRLLKDGKVKAEIAAALARRGRKLNITADAVIQELAKLAFFDLRSLFRTDGTMKDLTDLDDVSAAAVSGFEVVVTGKDGAHTRPVLRKIRLADKGAALEKLGRHLGLFDATGDATGNAPGDRLQELIDAFAAGPVPAGATVESHLTTEPGKEKHESIN